MRVVLMGTGPFAVPTFDQIVRDGHAIAAVVARPPVPTSSGKAPPESPVIAWAKQSGLPIATPDSINTEASIQWLREQHADLLVVCDYGQILSRDALAAARLGGINLHGSLLPRHRGAAPVQWSILSGDEQAGISVIHMTPQLDGGPVLTREATPIAPGESAGDLEARLSQLGVAPSMAAIAALSKSDHPEGIVQNPALATRAPRLKKSDGLLHLGYAVAWIDRQIRGLQPWPGVYTQFEFPDGKTLRVIVHQARPLPMTAAHLEGCGIGQVLHGDSLRQLLERSPIEPPPSTSSRLPHLGLVARDGLVLVDRLQPAGKKPMAAEEFVRGYGRYATWRTEVPTDSHPLLDRMIAAFAKESSVS